MNRLDMLIVEGLDPNEIENVCPFPEREDCEGCGNYIEQEDLCIKEFGL